MRRRLVPAAVALSAACVGLGTFAGVALADGSATGATTSSTTTATAPAAHKPANPAKRRTTHKPTIPKRPVAPAAKVAVRLYLYDAFFVHHQTVDVTGRPLHVTGVVAPYVPDQKVTVRAYVGNKRVSRHRLRVRPTRTGRAGHFVATVVAPRAGTLRIVVSHRRSPRMLGFSTSRDVRALAPVTSSQTFTSLVQQRLAKRHFYLPRSGVWDAHTRLAIDAYHRLLGRGTSQVLDRPTLASLLDGKGTFHIRYPHDGKHVEGDLANQLLALIRGNRVQALYPISSGKPSTPTVLGRFRVYLRDPGFLPDGMYDSSFFYRGYAIHGYDPAPDYPASHGCMRLPMIDAVSVWNWLNYGDRVDVYQ